MTLTDEEAKEIVTLLQMVRDHAKQEGRLECPWCEEEAPRLITLLEGRIGT